MEFTLRNFTELELHLIQHFKNTEESMYDKEDLKFDESRNHPRFKEGLTTFKPHLLNDFVYGYSTKENGSYIYACEPSDNNLIKNFLTIANKDIEGSYQYNTDEYINIILKAINKLGL